MSVAPETSAQLIDIAHQVGYQTRDSFKYGPFKYFPPSHPNNKRVPGSRDDHFLLGQLSFPKVVESTENIRARIYRNLLIQDERRGIYSLLTLPHTVPTTTDTLLHAVRDFKEENPAYKDPRDFTGSCMSMPGNFAKLCADRYGMRIETPHFGDGESFFHEVAARGSIVVDWTVRQFPEHSEESYPYIYKMGTEDTFLGGAVERDRERQERLIINR